MFCSGCGSEAAGGGRFCVKCGAELPGTRPAAPPAVPGGQVTAERGAAAGHLGGGTADRGSTAHHGGAMAREGTPRNLLPWVGGLVVGALAGTVAVTLVLSRGGAEPAGDVALNAANGNLQRPLAPPATPRSDVTATPTVAPAPSRTPAVDLALVERGARTCLDGWVAATRSRDFETHMSFYADTLDFYYSRQNASVSLLRADRGRTFTRYHTLDVRLSNVVVTPDPSGLRASVTYDKTWSFSGDKSFSGSARQMVTLGNFGGRWLITGEKDLHVYYVNR